MKNLALSSLLVFASLAALPAAFAADTPTAAASPKPAISLKPAAAKAKTTTVFCAVTGEKVGDPSKSVGTSTYKGKTYYFCCAGCKPEFDKNPAKFAKAADAKAAKGEKAGGMKMESMESKKS